MDTFIWILYGYFYIVSKFKHAYLLRVLFKCVLSNGIVARAHRAVHAQRSWACARRLFDNMAHFWIWRCRWRVFFKKWKKLEYMLLKTKHRNSEVSLGLSNFTVKIIGYLSNHVHLHIASVTFNVRPAWRVREKFIRKHWPDKPTHCYVFLVYCCYYNYF